MAGILDQFPQWKKYWPLVQEAARRWGMNPNETLAVHIFENGAANPGAASSVGALGLAQIYDTRASSTTNSKGWKQFASRWSNGGGSGSFTITPAMKRDPRFATDYLAWRMAGSIGKFRDGPTLSRVDQWYRSGGYNPGFAGDSRGSGPSIYVANNAQSVVSQRPNAILHPVRGGGDGITSVWGDSRDNGAREHKGVDIAAKMGTPLIAVANGKVRLERGGAGGNQVYLGGKFYYAHLSKFAVKDGQSVKKGQVIGYVGNTGTSSTGPHLHFALLNNGAPVDPMNYLNKAENAPAGVEGEIFDGGGSPEPDPYESAFFPQGPVELLPPGGGPVLPGGGPVIPGFGSSGGLQVQNKGSQSTWQMIADQDGSSDLARQYAGIGEEPL